MLLCILTFMPLIWTSFAANNPAFCGFSNSDFFLDEDPLPSCSNPTLDSFKNHARSKKANAAHSQGLLPPWINIELARKGQKFAMNNLPEIGLSHLYGLVTAGYPDGAFLLMFTGLHDTKEHAAHRYMVTLTQILLWYQDPALDSNSSDFITSMSRVRGIHMAKAEAAAAKYNESGHLVEEDFIADYKLTTALTGPFFEDLNASSIPPEQRTLPPTQWNNFTKPFVPMNQQIAALTMFALVGYPVLFPDRLGLDSASDEDIWAFNHLWAVLGYAIGVQDEFNIALQPDLETVRKVYQEIFEQFNVPNLFNMDAKTVRTMEVILVGIMDLANGAIPVNYVLYRMLTDVFAIDAPNTFKTLPRMYKAFANQRKIKLAPDHKRTPLDDAIHGGLNIGMWSGIYMVGMEKHGPEYESRHFRANNVHFDRDSESFK